MRLEKPTSLLLQKNLVTMARNAVGSRQYRNFFVQFADGTVEDVLQDGELSCASFVSNLLAGFGLIDRAHAVTESTIRALEKAGWEKVEGDAVPGDVLVWAKEKSTWEVVEQDDKADALVREALEHGGQYSHPHIGIYVGEGMAVSNSEKEGVPVEHGWQSDGERVLVGMWRFDFENWTP